MRRKPIAEKKAQRYMMRNCFSYFRERTGIGSRAMIDSYVAGYQTGYRDARQPLERLLLEYQTVLGIADVKLEDLK
jgi:hypothetical protein